MLELNLKDLPFNLSVYHNYFDLKCAQDGVDAVLIDKIDSSAQVRGRGVLQVRQLPCPLPF